MTKLIHVAVGIIKNTHDQILIAKRAENAHQGGLWEFPGGKVEEAESVFDALKREFEEEVSLEINSAEPFMEIHHDYGDKKVFLDIWLCNDFSGTACGAEGQLIEWVELDRIDRYAFPEANKAIIKRLKA